MIEINVKLYGTLAERLRDYDPENGMTLRLEPGARIADLFAKLSIAPADTGVVAVDGRVARPGDELRDGARVRIFQVTHGG